MSIDILRDCKLWLDRFALHGDMNALGITLASDLQNNTTFGMTTRSRAGGLKTVVARHEGFWNGGTDQVDEVLFNRLGLADVPMTIAPQTGAEGEVAFSFKSTESEYAPGGAIGEMHRFSVGGESSSGPLVHGVILRNVSLAAAATVNGSAFLIGAASATQRLYAAVHVLSLTGGGTLDVKIQSDDAVGMASPTDRITFAQVSAGANRSQWAELAGPVTDTYYRVVTTLAGAAPTADVIVVFGIQ